MDMQNSRTERVRMKERMCVYVYVAPCACAKLQGFMKQPVGRALGSFLYVSHSSSAAAQNRMNGSWEFKVPLLPTESNKGPLL